MTVASGSLDRTIRVWSITTSELVAGPSHGHSKEIRSVSFSSDGEQLASDANDETVRVWDAQRLSKCLDMLSICFSPDSALFASSSQDNSIIIWDAKPGCIVGGSLGGHAVPVGDITFSVDNKYVISGSLDHKLRIWDAKSGLTVSVFEGQAHSVWCLALSADGSRIYSGSRDETIRLWDISGLLTEQCRNIASLSSDESWKDWILKDDGWIVDRTDRSNLLLWIPPDLRRAFCRHRNVVLSCECK